MLFIKTQVTYDRFFNNAKLKNEMHHRCVKGGFHTMIGENAMFILRTLSSIIFARLIIPEHFGLIAMVTALTVFAERFKDLGLDIATIQCECISHKLVSTLFWINSGIGLFLMALFTTSSPIISWFYKDDRLIPITISLSIGFLFGGATIQHQALLRRQMQFGKLAWINIISTSSSILIGVIVALCGYGYWSIVTRELTRAVIHFIAVCIVCPWIPSLPSKGFDVKSMLRFGSDVAGFNLITYFSRSLDQILLGKFVGVEQLGLYRQASQLISMPMEQTRFPLNSIAVPTLSALKKEPDRYRKYTIKLTEILSTINMPLSLLIALTAELTIPLILGNTWVGAIDVVRIKALTTFLQPFEFPIGFIMLTSDKSNEYLRYGIFKSLFVIIGIIIGTKWGIGGVACGLFIASAAYIIPGLLYGLRGTVVNFKDIYTAVIHPLIASLAMASSIIISKMFISNLNLISRISILLSFGLCSYFGVFLSTVNGRKMLFSLFSYAFVLFRQRITTN